MAVLHLTSRTTPIYQAVLTRDKEVVECLLSNNATNRSQIKAGLRLAREHRLDPIIGLLLRALGLDKERRILNLGGFDLIEIKPSWIEPSLGLKSSKYKSHSRHHSSRAHLPRHQETQHHRKSCDGAQRSTSQEN